MTHQRTGQFGIRPGTRAPASVDWRLWLAGAGIAALDVASESGAIAISGAVHAGGIASFWLERSAAPASAGAKVSLRCTVTTDEADPRVETVWIVLELVRAVAATA